MKVVKIGRDQCNDYIIGHPAISAFHAEVHLYENGAMQLVDHSSNGTFVNGNFVHNGSYMLMGGEMLVFPDQRPVSLSEIIAVGTQEPVGVPSNVGEYRYSIRPGMDFGATLGYFFQHYATFSGRARRQEYWYMFLWGILFGIIPIVNIFWVLITFIPSWALSVRRLHDVGRSGWWLLLNLIPIIGGIIIFIWTVSDSEQGENQYGESPKYY